MADSSHIQWTDATWNPVTGCTKVSEGCRHCYIDRTPPFRTSRRRFTGPRGAGEPGATTGVQLHPDRLDWPLRWHRPRRVFVNSLSDLFHAQVPDAFIAQVFQMMAAAPQHTFQVLTKRPGRMASLAPRLPELINRTDLALVEPRARATTWPLPNVWLGTSVEDQLAADLRIPLLLDTPAAVRFLSCEPLLARVSLRRWLVQTACDWCTQGVMDLGNDHLHGRCQCACDPPHGLDWVIMGGESGPGARPMRPEWAGDLIAQCQAAGVAPFVKQLGSAWARQHGADAKAGDATRWPPELCVRHYPASGAQP
jgi:protein gp37